MKGKYFGVGSTSFYIGDESLVKKMSELHSDQGIPYSVMIRKGLVMYFAEREKAKN